MNPRLHTARAQEEGGAIVAIVAIAMTAIVILAALVIDLGFVRGGGTLDQSNADLAALAGSKALGEDRFADACADIVRYVNTNAPRMPVIDTSSLCSPMSTTVCSGGLTSQAQVERTAGAYTIGIHFPVPDSEIADATFGAGVADGAPCDRMRLLITHRQPSFFGGIVGRSSYSTTRTATVRAGSNTVRQVPALWLLDPVGCTPLSVQGGGKVVAGDISNPASPIAGLITVDSNGTSGCGSGAATIQGGGSGTEIKAIPTTGSLAQRGRIQLFAMPTGATSCTGTTACNQSEVGSQVFPQPLPADERATRAPIDWAWNCKTSYPNYMGIAIPSCPAASYRPPYLDLLTAAIGTSGQPTGFQRWTSSYSCNANGNIVVSGNWWVDCGSSGGLSINNGKGVTFSNGNVVFDGGVKLNGGGNLKINTNNATSALPGTCVAPTVVTPCTTQTSAKAAFAYIRSGDLVLGGGTLNSSKTFVYLGPSSFLSGTGGSPPVMSAPTEGPFTGLTLWAEAAGAFTVSGGAGVSLSGTFFTPFADALTLTGGGQWGQQSAQFISYRLKVTGGSELTIAPDPNSLAAPVPKAPRLIR